ncbi:hypothetical protein [Mucilaginibacter sp. HD30]
MLKRCITNIFLTFIITSLCVIARGQSLRAIGQEVAAINNYNTDHTPEKIFIQTDKGSYFKGDTLWFKSYVFDAELAASAKSGLMYIEIADASNRVLTRNMVSLNSGIGWGNIALTELRYPEGAYILRAYTNWMRNFGDHYIFSKQFNIEGALEENWMVSSRFELNVKNGINNIKANLEFVGNNGRKMFAEDLGVRITAARSSLYRTKLRTGVDGSLAFDFNLPDNTNVNQLNILFSQKSNNSDVNFNVPVIINRDEKTDVQFMPEGGSIIGGMLNRIAFKAINENGKGVEVEGNIYNSKGQQVASFRSSHLGMGLFELNAETNEVYTAKVKYRNKDLSFSLPSVKSSGLRLQVNNVAYKDSIIVTVNPTPDIKLASGIYYVIGQTGSRVYFGALVNARKGLNRFSLNRSAFPTGVARFTVLNLANKPVAERLIFVNREDNISLNIVSSKQIYGTRDSVSLKVVAKDQNGAPAVGSFSLSVTDDAQVKTDTAGIDNITVNLVLTTDVKGYVENPSWYFSKGDTLAKANALDNLLLTQGWVNYNWDEAFDDTKPDLAFKPEPEFMIRGNVKGFLSKPAAKMRVVLLSTKPTLFTDTTTDDKGEFTFRGLYPADTVVYTLQARNKNDKPANATIDVQEFKAPSFPLPQHRLIPWYINNDPERFSTINTRNLYNQEQDSLLGVRQMQEVQIRSKKIVKDSKSLVGPGEADFTMNEEDMRAQGKATLGDVLKKNIKGFSDMHKGEMLYNIYTHSTVFIFDGISTLGMFSDSDGYGSYARFLSTIFNYITAEDVKGIEVMTTGNNQMPYTTTYVSPKAKSSNYTFVEVTTYSGNGIFMKKTPGFYLHRPLVFASAKEFYSPKYTFKNYAPTLIDSRATVYWNPNIITAQDGSATVSFYTGDKGGTYTLTINGADMRGLVGSKQAKIMVKH